MTACSNEGFIATQRCGLIAWTTREIYWERWTRRLPAGLYMADATPTKTPEDAKQLFNLCRAGRLYEIEKWIAAGKSLEIPSQKYETLLQVAVSTGFHSLIELIAKNENNQPSKNAALADAVSLRKLDFVQLLVEN